MNGGFFFISYKRENLELASQLHSFLEANGVDAWMDRKIGPGTVWTDELLKRIVDSAGIMILLSNELNRSESSTVLTEISAANENQKRILPIKLCQEALSQKLLELLGDIEWLDLSEDVANNGDNSIFERNKQEILEFCNRWESDEQLLSHESWLTASRKQQIAVSMKRHLIQLEKHRHQHLQELTKHKKQTFSEPSWWRLSATHSEDGNRAIIGFRHKQCAYRTKDDKMNLGCFNCGYYAGAAPQGTGASLIQLKQQLLNGLRQVFEHSSGVNFDVIEFLSDGSFLDANEYEVASQRAILNLLSRLPWLRRVLIESRPEYVEHQRLIGLLSSLNPARGTREIELEIGIGLETGDDFIRQVCINKGFARSDFEHALDEIVRVRTKGFKCSAVCYLILKPAFLTEKEAIEDTIRTLKYLRRAAVERGYIDLIRPKLEPAAVSRGTMLSLLYKEGEYKPLNYWSVLEILTRAVQDPETGDIADLLRIGAREDMDDVAKVPAIYADRDGKSRFDQVDFAVYTAIQNFNRHGGIAPSEFSEQGCDHRSVSTPPITESGEPTAIQSNAFSDLLAVYSSIRSAMAQEDRTQFAFESRNLWKQDVFGNHGITTAIESFFESNESVIAVSEGSTFLEEIYQALDVIESFDAKRSLEFLHAVIPLLDKGDREGLAKLIEGSFKSDLVGVRVVDVDEESDVVEGQTGLEHTFYRVFLEVQDFVSRKVYPIWTQIDTSSCKEL
jgi:radical SAM enzyme (TIGR01210 family)